jgi:hypothetical protein
VLLASCPDGHPCLPPDLPSPPPTTDPGHARPLALGECPGLLELLAMLPDPRDRRGRRHTLASVLAVEGPIGPSEGKPVRSAQLAPVQLEGDDVPATWSDSAPEPALSKASAPVESLVACHVHLS